MILSLRRHPASDPTPVVEPGERSVSDVALGGTRALGARCWEIGRVESLHRPAVALMIQSAGAPQGDSETLPSFLLPAGLGFIA